MGLLDGASWECLADRQSVASLILFYRYYVGRYLSEMHELLYSGVECSCYLIGCMIFLSLFLNVIRMSLSTVFPCAVDYVILYLKNAFL